MQLAQHRPVSLLSPSASRLSSASAPTGLPACVQSASQSLLLIGQQTLNAQYDFIFFDVYSAERLPDSCSFCFVLCFVFFAFHPVQAMQHLRYFTPKHSGYFSLLVCHSHGSFIQACTECFTVGIGSEGHNIHQDDGFLDN